MSMQLHLATISPIKTEDTPIPNIKEMKFGVTNESGTPVFNYTQYLINIEKINGKNNANDVYEKLSKMMADCTMNITAMVKSYDIPSNKIVFNDGKNIYINSILATVVASYYFPAMISEAFSYLRDAYTFGFALSDSVLYQQCAYNMSNEMLMAILQSRNINETESQSD